MQFPVASSSRPSADSSADEEGDGFEVLSSSSVEERDESKSLVWAEIVEAVRAFYPEAVVRDESSSLKQRTWQTSASSSAVKAQLVESPLIFEAMEKALSSIRRCDIDDARAPSEEFLDFPSAKGIGSFLSVPKRGSLFNSAVKLKVLPRDKLKPSRHDWALSTGGDSMPKDVQVPAKALSLLQEALARALETTSILDSVSLALGNVVSGGVPDPALSVEQALPVLLQAVDALVQKQATLLSGAYVNALLVQRDVLLKRSSLQPAFKASLRAAPVSAEGLFGACAKAAVEESAKRTADQAFAAIARQGKRSQSFQSRQAKRQKTSAPFAGRGDARPFKAPWRPGGQGRGARRASATAPPKKQSKGVSPQ
jgi:hypothetical protein